MQLAAQAEAEKRNIGTVDSLHKEVDHVKNVIEEKESIHREFNKYAVKTLEKILNFQAKGVLKIHSAHFPSLGVGTLWELELCPFGHAFREDALGSRQILLSCPLTTLVQIFSK